MKRFPFYKQLDVMDCGPTCLRMIAKSYGRYYTLQYLREHSYLSREGVSIKGISEAAEKIGFRSMAVKIPFKGKPNAPSFLTAPLPVIAHWNQNHFVVVYRVSKEYIWVADPAAGKVKLNQEVFKQHWLAERQEGILLLLEPTPDFYANENQSINK